MVNDVGEEGLSEIIFPVRINSSPKEGSFYLAQRFKFINRNMPGYIGLRPSNGSAITYFAIMGSEPADIVDTTHCYHLNNTQTVMCRTVLPEFYHHVPYYLSVERNITQDSHIWHGYLSDGVDAKIPIGSWQLRNDTKGIRRFQTGHIGNTFWHDRCSDLAVVDVEMYKPIVSNHETIIYGPVAKGPCRATMNLRGGHTEHRKVRMAAGFYYDT
ncbi:hypothetical protein TRVA0_020S00760 [Trichomonascus vanleenenianus]|uniref:uncharacterized protein n=1 Tax=Trichomonascus vanleenenianus TaxID=2268995 RepID=UPI003ECB2586